MFVVADIIARHERTKGKNVFFPVASHYSGNSAQKISKIFLKKFSESGLTNDEEKKIFFLYRDFYNTPISVLKTFSDPLNLLSYYDEQILWELKALGISCDYKYFYTTAHNDFSVFVNTIISLYENKNLLIKNDKGDLALDYNNEKWKNSMLDLLNRTEFIKSFHKNNILSAIKDVRNDWGLFRKNGFGIEHKTWIIDPMFDSEIFSIFDLYVKFIKNREKPIDTHSFFTDLFSALQTGKRSDDALINKIIDSLPCDLLICEEHLKNWVVKKLYAESLLLADKFQTKKYFILGMGFLDRKHMSASKGNAILAKDIITNFGPITARLIILLSGGHPSKMYSYDKSLPAQAQKLLRDFSSHYVHLLSISEKGGASEEKPDYENVREISKNIEYNLEKVYYRQATIELLSILPKEYYKSPSPELALSLRTIYAKYCNILLPGLLNNFHHEKLYK